MSVNITFTVENRNPETIWNKLAKRLGRNPTNTECRDEIRRIIAESRLS